ncbi:HutD family protein [Deltaproteobacteria bacterium OttesenSCG-928-M10]|nr:HutD family protein [Deltaproteobacteria bacterium OttesenSCG-928-M10]
MNYRVLKPEDYRQMPWKNGLGTTCEILREPAGDEVPFDWRVSIAEIKENGPFSLFPQYMRVINTLEGRGMVMTVDGVRTHPLLKYDPYVFHGASRVESELIDGPIRDFNLIYRPDVCPSRLGWYNVHQAQRVVSRAGRILVFTVHGLTLESGGVSVGLDSWCTLDLSNDSQAETALVLTGPDDIPDNYCCVMEIKLP